MGAERCLMTEVGNILIRRCCWYDGEPAKEAEKGELPVRQNEKGKRAVFWKPKKIIIIIKECFKDERKIKSIESHTADNQEWTLNSVIWLVTWKSPMVRWGQNLDWCSRKWEERKKMDPGERWCWLDLGWLWWRWWKVVRYEMILRWVNRICPVQRWGEKKSRLSTSLPVCSLTLTPAFRGAECFYCLRFLRLFLLWAHWSHLAFSFSWSARSDTMHPSDFQPPKCRWHVFPPILLFLLCLSPFYLKQNKTKNPFVVNFVGFEKGQGK